MRDLIPILALTAAFIVFTMAWRKQAHIESDEVRSFKNSLYCDDDCLHCENNDWCKFSEVKK